MNMWRVMRDTEIGFGLHDNSLWRHTASPNTATSPFLNRDGISKVRFSEIFNSNRCGIADMTGARALKHSVR